MRTLREYYAGQVAELARDAYDVGTYNVDTLEPVTRSEGYQVTFFQVGADWDEAEFGWLVEFFQDMGDGITYAGKFDGVPELSWCIKDKRTALQLARDYNQISVWDWAHGCEILTGGTGRVA